jgi:SAM-dependent methyltransferase
MSPWYEHFFEGLSVVYWNAAVPPSWTRAEIDFLWSVLELKKGASVLDVPCGAGRHALPLAARGIRVTGFDISKTSIQALRTAARRKNLPVEARRGDLADLAFGGPFSGAYCLGNSFGYFDDPGMERFCRNVAGALAPGKRFVVYTTMAAESLLPDFREREWMEAGGIELLLENHYDAERSVLETHYTFIKNGRKEKHSAEHRIYTIAEIRRLLTSAGFQIAGCYGSTERTPFQLMDPQLYLVAEKA